MKKTTKSRLGRMLNECVLQEIKKKGEKQNQNTYGSFSQEMDQIKLDLEELYDVMETLKQYMKDINDLERSWKSMENLNVK